MADFYDEVLSHVRYATAREREDIRAELEGHVEDRIEALTAAGCDPEEARGCSLAAMGDPGEIGRGLDRQYTHLGLWLYRAVTAALLLVILSLGMNLPLFRLHALVDNLTARWAPDRSDLHYQQKGREGVVEELDLRFPVGSDILHVYRTVFDPETGEAEVYFCNYDKNLFGQAASLLYSGVEITAPSGGTSRSGGGGGSWGAYYWRESQIQTAPEDDHLLLRYESFGEHLLFEIPLDRGEGIS